jgi:DtxR family Mn-dependent transcriptional regulator
MAVSAAMQEYLAEAYRLAYYNPDEPFISTSSLAAVKDVTAAAVTRMVQRLTEAGYLEHEPYRGIRLTAQGEREALLNIRRHRLVECFLVQVMGLGWHEVHDDADTLGATVSDETVRRMEALVGNPRRCPHGEPIPTVDGFMPRVNDQPLNDPAAVPVADDTQWVISRVNTHDADKLAYLGAMGLTPGVAFTLQQRAPFNGPLQILVGTTPVVLGHEIAGVLRVCPPDAFALPVG